MDQGINLRNSAYTLFHNQADAGQFLFFRIGTIPKQIFLIPCADGDEIVSRIPIIKAAQPVLLSRRQFHIITSNQAPSTVGEDLILPRGY